jgi:hypothetical protein
MDAIGVPQESLMNSKQGTRKQQDSNQHSSIGPLLIKKWTGLTVFIITSRDFVNYTRDAVRRIAELGPTSKMAWENQMVLDMILAEKGGYVS